MRQIWLLFLSTAYIAMAVINTVLVYFNSK